MTPLLPLLLGLACWVSDGAKLTPELVRARGYPLERHNVSTADGYVLTAFRIPHGRRSPREGRGPPVLLQHALLCSSEEWVSSDAENSLAFVLADAGFDVWLGNNRGNAWGLGHTSLDAARDGAFWDFSWDEMALFDLPALVGHVLSSSGYSSLSYVGHSEGTLQALAAFSHDEALAPRVKVFVALAPVAYVANQGSWLVSLLDGMGLAGLLHSLGFSQFLPASAVLSSFATWLSSLTPHLVGSVIALFCGPSKHMDLSRLPVYLSNTPSGTSLKNMLHWSQQLRTGRLARFDYGDAQQNLARYNQSTPPLYDLGKMRVKTALFTGGRDILADATDLQRLRAELPPGVLLQEHGLPEYAHLDFAWGRDAGREVYADVLAVLRGQGEALLI